MSGKFNYQLKIWRRWCGVKGNAKMAIVWMIEGTIVDIDTTN